MQHFPIFVSTSNQRVVVSGVGAAAIAKLRLLMKTEATLLVYALSPAAQIVKWGHEKRITLVERRMMSGDAAGALLVYGANEDAVEDARVAKIGRAEGVMVNVVDNLNGSDFITPAIVDRDPVTIAIGTEGAAPILARAIKADIEERLSPEIGLLARLGKAFRPLAERLPMGRARRAFWAEYYFDRGPKVLATGGVLAVTHDLDDLLDQHLNSGPTKGHVDFVTADSDDPELLTLKARKALDSADVVVFDAGVHPQILELARREALIVEAGDVRAVIDHAKRGAHVVRLIQGANTDLMSVARAGVSFHDIPAVSSPIKQKEQVI
ncbi:MAG: NAD(P)-dependent oxidoreductase [Paracoccaceae bacterium]